MPHMQDDFHGELLSNNASLTLIAGPCAIESRAHALEMAYALKEIAQKYNIKLIYKSSFDKANRSSLGSYRGLGLTEGLNILHEVREKTKLPIITDIHSPEQAAPVADVVDIIQIPAFLCRQTDLLIAAAKTMKPVSVKKGQFLSPWDMKNIIEKIKSTGNENISLCERGTSFGYGNLVVDMRSLAIMKNMGVPVIFDATHSVQLPGALGSKSDGQREFILPLARAAVSIGIAAIFVETHQDPDKALCDGANMLPLKNLSQLLFQLCAIDALVKQNNFHEVFPNAED